MKARLLGTAALAAALGAALVGCSGDDEPSASGESGSSDPSASASPYLPVPDGVTLTPQGTHLEVGDQGVLAWEPRQDLVGVLDLTVTKIEQTTAKKALSAWQLSEAQAASTPFFVHVTVTNAGETDLSGRRVPLYAVNDQNLLLESTPFKSSFEACPSTPLPDGFTPGKSEDVCLVYLAPDHGTLEAVSFRPEETFDPIIWTGTIETYTPPKAKKSSKAKGGNG